MDQPIRTITRKDVTEYQPHQFGAEASSLGLPPGFFPTELATTIGNMQNLILATVKRDDEGGILYVRYRQMLGCINVVIFND